MSSTYSPDQGDYTPNGSLLFSDTFANDTFGILADIAYSDHKAKVITSISRAGKASPPPAASPAWRPAIRTSRRGSSRTTASIRRTTEDKRVDGRVVLQWRPTSNLQLTANYNYSRDEVSQIQYGYSVWFNAGSMQNVELNDHGTVINFVQPNTPTDFQSQIQGSIIENQEYGFNAEWAASDNLSFVFDADHAKAQLNPGGEFSSMDVDVGYGPSVPGDSMASTSASRASAAASLPYPTAFGPSGDESQFVNNGLIGSHVLPHRQPAQPGHHQPVQAGRRLERATSSNIRLGAHYLRDEKELSNYGDFGNNDWQAFAGYGPSSGNGTGMGGPDSHCVAHDQSWFTHSFSTSNFINGFGQHGLPSRVLVFNAWQVRRLSGKPRRFGGERGDRRRPERRRLLYAAFDGTYQIALDPAACRTSLSGRWQAI